MASKSEVTFGARLNNAQTLQTHLQSFKDYTSSNPALLPAALQTFIDDIRSQNESVAGETQAYSNAVNKRQQLFKKDSKSLEKIMSPIGSEIRSVFGKDSKEAAYITGIVNKIRGEKISRTKNEPDAEFVSQSERSFGSMTQNFSDMITTLTKYGNSYSPANKTIQVPALAAFRDALEQANNDVTTAFGKLKIATDKRAASYDTLTNTCQRVKDAVKSQYLVNSSEYALVKGLRI